MTITAAPGLRSPEKGARSASIRLEGYAEGRPTSRIETTSARRDTRLTRARPSRRAELSPGGFSTCLGSVAGSVIGSTRWPPDYPTDRDLSCQVRRNRSCEGTPELHHVELEERW